MFATTSSSSSPSVTVTTLVSVRGGSGPSRIRLTKRAIATSTSSSVSSRSHMTYDSWIPTSVRKKTWAYASVLILPARVGERFVLAGALRTFSELGFAFLVAAETVVLAHESPPSPELAAPRGPRVLLHVIPVLSRASAYEQSTAAHHTLPRPRLWPRRYRRNHVMDG